MYCTFHRRANGHRIQQERVVLAGEKYQKPTASNYRMHIFKYAQKNPCHLSIHISECWSHPIDGVQLVVDHSFVSCLKAETTSRSKLWACFLVPLQAALKSQNNSAVLSQSVCNLFLLPHWKEYLLTSQSQSVVVCICRVHHLYISII